MTSIGRQPVAAVALAGLCLIAAGSTAAQEQDAAQWAAEISQAQQANAARLASWSWKSRIGIEVGNGPTLVKLFTVRIEGGEVVRTLIGGSSAKKAKKKKAKAEQKQEASAQEWLEHVATAVRAYTMPTQAQLTALFENANFVAGSGATEGTLRVRGTDFVQPGDSVIMWLDQKTKLPIKLEFRTKAGDETLEALISYKTLKDGTSYGAKGTLQAPSTQVNATVENFGHLRQEN